MSERDFEGEKMACLPGHLGSLTLSESLFDEVKLPR